MARRASSSSEHSSSAKATSADLRGASAGGAGAVEEEVADRASMSMKRALSSWVASVPEGGCGVFFVAVAASTAENPSRTKASSRASALKS
jgi:hypothetical protein